MSVINTNVKALAAQASMSNVNKSMETAMERLSTGIRINSAKDDAAGLAIALRMTADIRGTAVAIRNANDAISLSQTAEGGLGQINDILQRMRELAVQSSNGTASSDNRAASQLEISQLKQEIDTIAGRTNFNGIKLLDGSAAKLSIQTGVNAGDMMTMNISAARTQDIGVGGRASLTATGQNGATPGSLAKNLNAGDLIINGVQVGASRDLDDNVSANPFETVTFNFTTGAGAATDKLTVNGTEYTASGALSATATRDAFVTYFNANNTNYSATAVDTTGVRLVSKTTGNKTDAVFAVSGANATIATSTVQYINGGGDQSSSAIAKVAAINAVSAQSGVIATVGSTVVAGSAQTAAALTGQIFINGVGTGSFSTTGDAGVSRANTVAAINLISGQTGVRAVDTGDIKKGVQLIADDGRNVIVGYNTLTAATTGVAAAGVNTGSYQLTSTSGGNINLSTSSSGNIANAGLAVGNFVANVSTVTSTSRSSALSGAAPSDTTTGVLAAGTMRINSVAIDAAATASDTASDVTATSSTKAASAIAIAAAINAKSSLTGVTAKANANVIVGTEFDTTGSAAKVLRLNGINIALSIEQSSTRGGIVTEVNKFTGQTGVVATDNGRGLTLTAADGRNISISLETNNTTATANETAAGVVMRAKNIGLGVGDLAAAHVFSHATAAPATLAATTYAGVTLNSELAFNLEGGSDGNTNFSLLGFKTGTFGGSNNGIKISNIDVSSLSGAQLAITALDAAMKTVSMNQAQLGAYQNRLDSAIANLTEGSTNMNASRSRVLDTDYAKESTNLAKAQIISQAATAMLAQANQSAQSVLALLK
jgi:flagellin